MPISKITNITVQEHINDLSRLGGKDGMSEAYLTRVKVFLHMVFNYAILNKLIVVNPTLGVKIPKTGPNENRSLTKEEELRLLQAVMISINPLCLLWLWLCIPAAEKENSLP